MRFTVNTIILSVSFLQSVYAVTENVNLENAQTTPYLTQTTNEKLLVVRSNTTDFQIRYCYENEFRRANAGECCRKFARRFRYRWLNGGRYLTTHLSRLRDWNCEGFRNECEYRRYAFNDFTELVYDRFCNPEEMKTKCLGVIMNLLGKHSSDGGNYINENNKDAGKSLSNVWDNLTTELVPAHLPLQDLITPCVQIALFDRPNGDVGRFHEVVEPFVPFCEMIWVGYDIETAVDRGVSPWTGMSPRCRASIVISVMVIVLLGIAITTANAIVIAVYTSTPKLRNSQAIYKLSIAFGDFLVGIIVCPSIVFLHNGIFLKNRQMGDVLPQEDREYLSDTTLEKRGEGGSFESIVSWSVIRFIGFFTTLSLVVSVYTLLMACFDRLLAISWPLKYNKNDAKRYSKKTAASVWVMAVIVAALPTFINELSYNLTSVAFVTSSGEAALILIALALLLPLVAIWSVTIAMYCMAKKHARNRRRLTQRNKNKSLEARLAKTLSLMVGIFSACVIPVILVSVAVHFIDNVTLTQPSRLNPTAAIIYNSVEYCASLILMTNSLWNCFVYSFRSDDFRTRVKEGYGNLVKRTRLASFLRIFARSVYSSMRRLSQYSIRQRRKSAVSIETGGTYTQRTSMDV